MEKKTDIERNRCEIEIGATLKIQVAHFAGRLESTLIGIRHDKYIILTMPSGPNQSAAQLHEPLVIRYIHKGNAYGFKATVLDVITSQEKLLIISYPVRIEVFELRDYPRLNCFLPARLFIGEQVIDGSVIDINRTGVRYTCSLNKKISQIEEHVDGDINLDLQIPGTDGYTHIVGNLRNVHISSDKMNLGIRFEKINTHQLTNLLSFLLDAHALPGYQKLSTIISKQNAWREKVSNFIHADVDVEQDFALSPNECDLGKWLNSKGKTEYGGSDGLHELDKIHRNLHHQVETAVELRRKGKKTESVKFFNKLNIEHISHRIAALLIAVDESRALSMDLPSSAQSDTQSVEADAQSSLRAQSDS